MTPIESFAGMEVYTNDDKRVGRVEQTHRDGGAEASEYVTIDRPRARDIAVPLSILRVSGDHLVLPFGMTVVESAPNVSPRRRAMTIEEKWILDSFYSLWTGVPVTKVEIVKGQSITQEGEGAEVNEKAKQATDRAKDAADQIIEKAKVQSAELIQRSKVKEAELREQAEKQAAELRAKAKQQAADLREKAKLEAAGLLKKARAEAADLRGRAKKEAKKHLDKVTSKV